MVNWFASHPAEKINGSVVTDLFAQPPGPPDKEWPMRKEMRMLKTRLEDRQVRKVHMISLADLLWKGIDESEGMVEAVLAGAIEERFPQLRPVF